LCNNKADLALVEPFGIMNKNNNFFFTKIHFDQFKSMKTMLKTIIVLFFSNTMIIKKEYEDQP